MAELYPVTTHAYHPVTDRPTVLCIGGVDSAGLAGLHMDARSCEALDIHAAAAVTATTGCTGLAATSLHKSPSGDRSGPG